MCAWWERARSAARWPAGWPPPASPPWWWTVPPLPPMEHPAFDGRAYAIAAGSRRLLEEAGVWDRLAEPACPILDIRVSDGRLGRPASPLFLHFDHRERRRGGIRPHGGGAQPARGAERAHARAAGAARVRPGRGRGGAARRRAPPCASPAGPRIDCRLVVAAEGRNSPLRRAAGIPVTQSAVRPDRHRLRDQPRAAAPQHGARAFPAVRPVRAAADVRQPRCAGRRRAQCLRHRLDRAHARSRERMLALDDARFASAIARRLGGHLGAVRVGGPALELSARRAARASLLRHAAGAGGRCGAHHPSDRRPGPQPGLPRCDGAGRPADRGVAPRRGPGRAGPAAALPAAAAAGQSADAGGDRRARPAVQQRQSAAAAGARCRHRRRASHAAAEAAVHAPGDGRCTLTRRGPSPGTRPHRAAASRTAATVRPPR